VRRSLLNGEIRFHDNIDGLNYIPRNRGASSHFDLYYIDT